MNPLDNLRRLVAGWRGEWRVDAHEGITLSHDGEEWPIGALDGDATIVLVELLNAIRPAVDGATAEIERLTAELAAARAVPPDVEASKPATVGGLLATARCSCTSEAGDSRCDAHPSCSECGDQTARNVDDCADHCQACASLRRGDAISITSAAAMCSACKARGPIGEG